MPLPFVAAWKAWALRVAERLARPSGPEAPVVQRAKPRPKPPSPGSAPGGPPAPHRSGRRHG